MVVRIKEGLREGGLPGLSLRVGDAKLVKGLGDRRSGPDLNVGARQVFDFLDGLALFLLQLVNHPLTLFPIKADAAIGYTYQDWQQFSLKREDTLEFFLTNQRLKMMPKLQGQRGVLLGICSDIHRRELPEATLGIHTEVLCRFPQGLLGLGLLKVVIAECIQAVAESVLVQKRSGKHRIVDGAVDLEALCQQPT